MSNPAATARLALSCLDLTSLNAQDTEADIAQLCQRAQSRFGPVAAVCVWPRLAGFARRQLPPHIAVAAVANFPDGSADVERAVREAGEIVQSGAQEVDVVLPYAQLLLGHDAEVAKLLAAVRRASEGLRLKVILETGVLLDPALILRASRLSLEAGADFLKTSTGKTAISATPEAARVMLGAIAADPAAHARVGFKPSGGIRTVADAAVYIALCEELLGPQALTPQRFRIGASSVLADIEAVLAGEGPAATAPAGSY
ncbi:deoxyribose-phosphate aldolase [Rhodoferax lacus]|uniref:Deoxyribose-phosphate aldolase n=1 Tax=Rhodoferax lacus TaxID=2184758 RepID=A0A3E1RHF8_9BURK|nr:deoxyribose-phosphate aldolase [Rhodoferax lacus]